MVRPETLIRKHLLKIKAYSSARDEYKGEIGIFLDANENSFGSSSKERYNRYPDPHHKALKQQWSHLKGVAVDQIFFGNGSDEPIDLLIRLFCEPGIDSIITLPPTYGMYEVSAAINNVRNKQLPLTNDFQIDLPLLQANGDVNDKLIFLCTPNNPSGNLLNRSAIFEVLKTFKGMVVVDEAYVDFSPEESWTSELKNYPNLVVLQTLSKAWGMAAIRVGVAMANPSVVAIMDRIKPPYNLSLPNQKLALEALQNPLRKEEYVKKILDQRLVLEEELSKLSIVQSIVPSASNFLLVKFEKANDLFEFLIQEKVIVRNRTKQLHCEHGLRVTVGKPEENQRLIALIKDFQDKHL